MRYDRRRKTIYFNFKLYTMPELTVGQAIDLLAKYPRDIRIMVHGYEEGFEDPIITEEMVVPIKDPHAWEGPFYPFRAGGGTAMGYFNAVVFGRDKRRLTL